MVVVVVVVVDCRCHGGGLVGDGYGGLVGDGFGSGLGEGDWVWYTGARGPVAVMVVDRWAGGGLMVDWCWGGGGGLLVVVVVEWWW